MHSGPGVLLVHPLLPTPEQLVDSGVSIGVALLFAFVVQRVLFLVVGRLEKWIARAAHHRVHAEQRARTIGGIMRSLITVVVAAVLIIYALGVLGWDVK